MLDRWRDLCSRLPASPACDQDLLFWLVEAMHAHPTRAYHNLDHIDECLDALARWRGLAREPETCELAIWLHDSVYLPGRPDNEDRSAAMLRTIAPVLGLEPARTDRAARIIMATKHDGRAAEPDEQLVADIDLSGLARTWASYQRTKAAVRQEFAHASEEQWRVGRGNFLRGMLARPRIFHHAAIHADCERGARENLQRELDSLGAA